MRIAACLLCCLLPFSGAQALAACGSPQQNQIVPVASSGPGAQGSYWTTAIWLSDPGATPGEDTVVTGFAVDYLDLSTTHERQYTVPSNGTLEIADVIESLGLPTGRTFWVYFWGYKAFSVNARIYTTEAEGNGTYGQHVPVTYEDQGMAQGDIITFPVPLDYSRYRVNVGFTYGNGATTRLRLSVVRGDGTEASSQTVTLTGYQSVQLGAVNAALAGAAAGKVVIEALDDTGEDVFPYVSVVDMTTSDPVFLFYHTPCLP